MKNLIPFLLLFLFSLPFRILPYKACLAFGRFISGLLYPLSKKHRRIAHENISYAFPDYTEKQKQELIRKNYRHLGELLALTFYVSRIDRKWIERYIVEEESFAAIHPLFEKEKYKIYISGHIGVWEVLGAYISKTYSGGAVYKPLRNPLANRWLKYTREKGGFQLVSFDETFRIIKSVKSGKFMGLAADQNAGKAGIFVDFLNRPAATYQGPVIIASKTGARMFMILALMKNGKVHIEGSDLGFASMDGFEDKNAVTMHFTELWSKELEKAVYRYPEQYFWVHRRWRTKPGDFPGQV